MCIQNRMVEIMAPPAGLLMNTSLSPISTLQPLSSYVQLGHCTKTVTRFRAPDVFIGSPPTPRNFLDYDEAYVIPCLY